MGLINCFNVVIALLKGYYTTQRLVMVKTFMIKMKIEIIRYYRSIRVAFEVFHTITVMLTA